MPPPRLTTAAPASVAACTTAASSSLLPGETTAAALDAFNKAVRRLPEVEQCHMIAGGFDYLLKVRTRDISSYRQVLGEKISALPHVAQTSTYVVMEAVKDLPAELG